MNARILTSLLCLVSRVLDSAGYPSGVLAIHDNVVHGLGRVLGAILLLIRSITIGMDRV